MTEPDIVARSLLPVYQKSNFSLILQSVMDEKKVGDFVELYSWNPDEGRVLDLQYQPILSSDSYLLLPLHILLYSNYLRNTLYAIKKRLYTPDEEDPMTTTLVKLLKERFSLVKSGIEYDFIGYAGDIDIIAKAQDIVFVFECKRSLLSGNIYELRTIHDHINKAAEQLNKVQSAFKNDQFIEYLSNKLGWPLDVSDTVVTCIVIGNRMLSGFRPLGHPVRGFYELANFIYSGEVEFRDGILCQWRNEQFDAKDLQNYLQNDSFHRLLFECMFPKDVDYSLADKTLKHKSFYTNYELIFEKYKENYSVRPPSQEMDNA